MIQHPASNKSPPPPFDRGIMKIAIINKFNQKLLLDKNYSKK